MCFDFFHNFFRNISYFKKNSTRYYHKCTQVFCKLPVILLIIYPILNVSTDFRKVLKYQFSLKSVQWWRGVPCGRKDRHDEANSRFSHFWKSDQMWNISATIIKFLKQKHGILLRVVTNVWPTHCKQLCETHKHYNYRLSFIQILIIMCFSINLPSLW